MLLKKAFKSVLQREHSLSCLKLSCYETSKQIFQFIPIYFRCVFSFAALNRIKFNE